MSLTLLYRGPLTSCNYHCGYCPFAMREEDARANPHDRAALERFVEWATITTGQRLAIFFTPWGEALIHPWYQRAIATLSRLDHVTRVAIQTNLSGPLGFLESCQLPRVALWCTYHPTEVDRPRFLARCGDLLRRGARFSVGVVGIREHLAEIEDLRRELPREVYLWINAVRRITPPYTDQEIERLTRVDPLFPRSFAPRTSLGAPCRAGEHVVSVDGDGTVRRCHFVSEVLGNLYEPGWEASLGPRPCPNPTCTCHIGYVHRKDLDLYDLFADGVLERIPTYVSTIGA